jgi:hypothetical protein
MLKEVGEYKQTLKITNKNQGSPTHNIGLNLIGIHANAIFRDDATQ